jgi:predicted AAA+ superfamily ATPase
MKTYTPRLIDSLIKRKLQASGGVLLQGARAVGKTTTALHHANSFVSLDASEQILTQASLAPKSLLSGDTPRLIDEWRLVPSIWNAVRHEIDARSQQGQFILTGSAAPSEDKTRHTGAGRFSRLTLKPMTLCESNESTMQVDFAQLFYRDAELGGFGGLTVEDYANKIVRSGRSQAWRRKRYPSCRFKFQKAEKQIDGEKTFRSDFMQYHHCGRKQLHTLRRRPHSGARAFVQFGEVMY